MKDFINEWGQTHEEICANLGYDEETADDLLVDEYFFDDESEQWFPKFTSMYSEEEQTLADELRNN